MADLLLARLARIKAETAAREAAEAAGEAPPPLPIVRHPTPLSLAPITASADNPEYDPRFRNSRADEILSQTRQNRLQQQQPSTTPPPLSISGTPFFSPAAPVVTEKKTPVKRKTPLSAGSPSPPRSNGKKRSKTVAAVVKQPASTPATTAFYDSDDDDYFAKRTASEDDEEEDDQDDDGEESESSEEEDEDDAYLRVKAKKKKDRRKHRTEADEQSPSPSATLGDTAIRSLDDLMTSKHDGEDDDEEEEEERGIGGETTTTAAAAAAAAEGGDAVEKFIVFLDNQGKLLPTNIEQPPPFDFEVPESIAKHLRPYQRQGIIFLLKNYAQGRGALLADDMGLGKTLQSIAFLSAIMFKKGVPKEDHFPITDGRKKPLLHPAEILTEAEMAVVATGGGRRVADDSRFEVKFGWEATRPCLIVCPKSLVDNWGNEFQKWGTFKVEKLHDSSKVGKIEAGLAALKAGLSEVGITTYDILKGKLCRQFLSIMWHVVIFDEAHKLKNPKAKASQAADRLATRLRFGLTGTPMANDYDELYHLLNLLAPGCLGDWRSFRDGTVRPIKWGMKVTATRDQIALRVKTEKSLKLKLKQHLLRRSKTIIAHQLPKKTDHIVFCQLAPMQLKAYTNFLQIPDVQLILNAKKACPCGSGVPRFACVADNCPGHWKLTYEQGGVLYPHYHFCDCDNARDPISNPDGCIYHRPVGCLRLTAAGTYRRACPYCLTFPLLTILKHIALHLELVKPSREDEQDNPRKFNWDMEIAEAVFGEDCDDVELVQSRNYLDALHIENCGKLATLVALLSGWYGDKRGSGGRAHKVLIFSTSVKMLKIVASMAHNKGWNYHFLSGATPGDQRQGMVDDFNSPESSTFLFIASIGAGSVGLNLTGANRVIILDPNYSPALDLQAMDRAFRIGQTRDVDVYRLVAAGTIEERIYMRQIHKQQHSNIAVEGVENQKRLFIGSSKTDQGELFGIENLLGTLLKEVVGPNGERRIEILDTVEAAVEADGGGSSSDGGGSGGGGGGTNASSFWIEEVPEEVSKAIQEEANRIAAAAEQQQQHHDHDHHHPQAEEEIEEIGNIDIDGDGDDDDEMLDVATLPGVMGVMEHAAVMAPSRRAQVENEEAVKNNENAEISGHDRLMAQAEALDAARGSMLECLACWKKKEVVEMARELVKMTPLERDMVRREYYEADLVGLMPGEEDE